MAGNANSGRPSARAEEATEDSFVLYQKSRAKEKTHKAKLAELEERKKKGELIETAVVGKEIDRAARMVRDSLMALPDRVGSLLVGRTETEILIELRKEIKSTLEHLSIEVAVKD